MSNRINAPIAGEGTDGRTSLPGQEYLDADDLGRRYKASSRSIFRWADAGLMPPGIKIGTLRRWSRREIEAWESGGCRPVRTLADDSR